VRALVLVLLAGCGFRVLGESPASDGSIDALDSAPADWWDLHWRWRIPIAITNGAAAPLPTGYQVGLARDLDAAPCTSNRDDIRIVRAGVELPRVIDEVGTTEWTWFRIGAPIAPGATSMEYWLYCGNPAPSPAPADAKMVFELYEDFSAALDPGVWTIFNTVSVANGMLTVGPTSGATRDHGIVTKTITFSSNHAVDYIATATSTTQSDWWAGFQNGTMDVAPWLHWYTKDGNDVLPDFRGVEADPAWYGTAVALDTQPHLYSVENYGDSSAYRRADVIEQSHDYAPMQPPPAQVNVRLWNGSADQPVIFDMVRVRRAVKPPPATATGTPETH